MTDLPDMVAADSRGIRRAAEVLLGGGVIAMPTETLYGLAALALDPEAVEAVARIKVRPDGNPFPVLVRDTAMVGDIVDHVPGIAARIMAAYWPGPLTLVLPARPGLSPRLVGEGGGVGVRHSPDPVVAALLELIKQPLTATSANLSGSPAATTAAQARLPGLGLVLDAGPRRAPASTVVSLLGDRPRILRPGPVTLR